MKPLAALFRRELSLCWAGGGGPALALGFYAALALLAPLAGGPGIARSPAVGAAIAWIGLLLANLLTIERLFVPDHEDGALDLLAVGPLPLEVVTAVKCLAHALAIGGPLSLAAPLAGTALGLPPSTLATVLAAAAASAAAFAFLGGVGATLALASRRGGLLVAVIVLPLLAPPVIFGGGALHASLVGDSPMASLALLTGYSLAAIALAPLAMASGCRTALE